MLLSGGRTRVQHPASSIQHLIPRTTKRRGEKAKTLKEAEREINQPKCSHGSLLVPLAFSPTSSASTSWLRQS